MLEHRSQYEKQLSPCSTIEKLKVFVHVPHFLCLLSTTTMSGGLCSIIRPQNHCILNNNLAKSFSNTDSGFCCYHLIVTVIKTILQEQILVEMRHNLSRSRLWFFCASILQAFMIWVIFLTLFTTQPTAI